MHPHALTNLSATEARLAAVLARPRPIAIACVLAFSGLGWLALGLMAGAASAPPTTPAFWQALCRGDIAGDWSGFAFAAAMWAAMALAMMLPTAGPMILTYAEIADTAAGKRERVVSPLILTAGYVTAWLGFALAAASLQLALARARLLDTGATGLLAAGTIVLVAGLYQFSALKHACLDLCQRPFPFFFSNWTTETRGVFRLGLRQGLYCLGCCWALMLVMLAAGAMNVVWMAALGALMTIEKMTTGARFSEAVGVAFVAIGLGLVAASVL